MRFLLGDLSEWTGLPELTIVDLVSIVGEPVTETVARLGRAPATRILFRPSEPARDFAVYVRNERVVLLEVPHRLPLSVLEELPQPDAILPHEVLDPQGYVHEYLYLRRGLALSVVEPFAQHDERRIARYRGFRSLSDVAEFVTEFYLAFEDQTYWSQPFSTAGTGHLGLTSTPTSLDA